MTAMATLEHPPLSPAELIATETLYGARNYKPLDVVLTRGEGPMSGTSRGGVTSTVSRPIPP